VLRARLNFAKSHGKWHTNTARTTLLTH